jgi:hypothetical protein
MVYDFSTTPMYEIIQILQQRSEEEIAFTVLNPNLGSGHYAGEMLTIENNTYPHHSLKAWSSLAELLGYRMLLPQSATYPLVTIHFQKLQPASSFHIDAVEDITEKYGSDSIFARLNKLEEPTFAWHYLAALNAVKIRERDSILNLGINKGYEFLGIRDYIGENAFGRMQLTGVDHSHSAISQARATLSYPNVTLHCHDINELHTLDIPRQDLIISIGTLQSPAINTKTLIMSLVQESLSPMGAIIFGFPNARWIDGELIHGAKAPNYPYPEMSLLIKDIYWIKKYLQQHKFRVTITGKEYLFLTATKIVKKYI